MKKIRPKEGTMLLDAAAQAQRLKESWEEVLASGKPGHLLFSSTDPEAAAARTAALTAQLPRPGTLLRAAFPHARYPEPYAPFPDILRSLEKDGCRFSLDDVYPVHRPLLRDLLDNRPIRRREPLLTEEIRWERKQLVASLASLLAEAARREPCILLLSGVHQAGTSTLTLIEELLHGQERAPYLLILLLDQEGRTPEEWMEPHWESFLLEMEDRILELDDKKRRTPEQPPTPQEPETVVRICSECLQLFAYEECRNFSLHFYNSQQTEGLPEDSLRELLDILGEIHLRYNDSDAALLYYNLLLNHLQEHRLAGTPAAICTKLASIHITRGNRDTAEKYLEQGARLLRQSGTAEELFAWQLARLLFLERFTEVSFTELGRLRDHLEETIRQGEQLDYRNSLGCLLEKAGFQSISLDSSRERAQEIYRRAMGIAAGVRNTFRLASLYGGMGIHYSIASQPGRAFRAYARSLKLKLRIGESKEAAKTCNSIGYLCYLSGDYVKAVKYYRRAISLIKEMMDFDEMTMTLFNMVQAFFYARDFPLALQHAELVLDIAASLKMRALPMCSLTEVYALACLAALRTGDHKKSLRYSSRIIRSSSGNDEYYFQLMRAQLYREEKKWKASETAFRRIDDSLKDRDKPFFMKNYAHYYSIPYLYEYAGMLREQGREDKALSIYRRGLDACLKTNHRFYTALFREALTGREPSVPRLDFSPYLVEASFLTAMTIQQTRFQQQEYNLTRLHKKINEINFLNTLQDLLAKGTSRMALIREVMELVHHKLLVEISTVLLREHDSWVPVFTSRPLEALPFPLEKLQPLVCCGEQELLVPDTSRDSRFSELRNTVFSLMSAPLLFDGTMRGALVCVNLEKGLAYSGDDLRILSIVAKQLSSALERIALIEQLKEMDRIKTLFFRNVSHETKTPLTLIGNYLDRYVERHGDSEELTVIRQNIAKLQRDMVNFLDGEKLAAGKIFYDHSQVCNLSDLAEKKAVLFSGIAAAKQLGFTTAITPGIRIMGDPFALDRVFNNLLDNAVKYTPAGGGIRLALAESGDEALLEVQDTGIGISPAQQEHIFELYHQISHNKRNLQGIGMGLYLVRQIVTSLGGRITVRSEEEKGSTFIVAFPAGAVAGAPPAEEWSTPLPAGEEPEVLPTTEHNPALGTILVVEDNRSLSALMLATLKERYNCYHADDGNAALARLTEIPRPGVIVSDVMMDGMDGFTFFRELRKKEEYREIPFIFLSARTEPEDRMQGLLQGALDYIPKPFRISELEAKIRSIMQLDAFRRNAAENEKMAAIGRLTAGISHEIFNPLSSIIGPVEYLEGVFSAGGTLDPQAVGTAFAHINDSVARIESIIRSLKTLYYRAPVDRVPIEVRQIVDSIFQLRKGKSAPGITFANDVPPDCIIAGDREALTRILVNLITNAADAVEGKNTPGNVTVTAAQHEGATVLQVRDTGTGIPEADQRRIFDLFYTTKAPGKGTGLGLHLVRELCLKLGWTVTVRSEEGAGTEFSVAIPQTEAAPPA